MFDTDESFLFGSGDNPTIVNNGRRSVPHVVQPKCEHKEKNNRTLARLQDKNASNCFLPRFSGTVSG